jgi:hypothetical protein
LLAFATHHRMPSRDARRAERHDRRCRSARSPESEPAQRACAVRTSRKRPGGRSR